MYYLSTDVNFFEKIVTFLAKRDVPPKAWESFHVISLIIIGIACIAAFFFKKFYTKERVAYITLICGIILLLFETYKQLIFTYRPATDEWRYSFGVFPFQFCSTPIYLSIIAFVLYKLKKEKIYNAILAFLATYCLIAGFIVLFFGTQTVFVQLVGSNIQSMVHHGIMILLGLIILLSGSISFNPKTLFSAFCVFLPLVFAAIAMNFAFGNGQKFDMFYLAIDSPFMKRLSLQLFGTTVPYPVYVIGYITLFTFASAVVLFIAKIITIKNKKSA